MAKATMAAPSKIKTGELAWSDRKNWQSPKGTSAYAYLAKPDEKFGAPTQKITVRFNAADPEFTAFKKELLSFENVQRKANGQPLVKEPSCISQDAETNSPQICFKRAAKEDGQGGFVPVPCFGPDLQPVPSKAWSGSIVRVGFGLAFWASAGKYGIKGYLNCVQVLKAATGSGGAESYFKVDDSFLTDLGDGVADEAVADSADAGDDADLL